MPRGAKGSGRRCAVGRSLERSREPPRVAEEFAVLDRMSGGRLIAGFPVALSYDANQNAGVPPIDTRARFSENRALIDKAWRTVGHFPWNGRFNKHPYVNIWPRPAQSPRPPIWAPAVGNPNTLAGVIDNDDVFVYLSWFGPKYTGQRVFDRYWDMAVARGRDANPYRLAFLQCVAVGETDAEAHREYGPHIEASFRNGLGSIPLTGMNLPGYMDIEGIECIVRDPGDFAIVPKMRTATYAELLDAQCAIVGGPDTVAEPLLELVRNFRIGNLLLMVQHGPMPQELTMKNISLPAGKVLPRPRGQWTDESREHRWWPRGIAGAAAKGG
jgi:alkanesulfonate monooxygenase SsuD/methylene tetrahydromethanopterin reductase-like flavin-dependent oxidoreductase (luciferase family)